MREGLGLRFATLGLILTLIAGMVPVPDDDHWTPPPPPQETVRPSPTPRPTPPPAVPGAALEDVRPDDWFYLYIRLGVRHGFLQGSNNRFEPHRAITRAELITMLGRMHESLGGTVRYNWREEPHLPYTDLPQDAFFYPYILWAAIFGIVEGDAENLFRPHAPVTREEFAVTLARYIGAYELEDLLKDRYSDHGLYTDWEDIAIWAYHEVHFLRNLDLMQGTPAPQLGDGAYLFRPQAHARRFEAAVILARLFEAVFEAHMIL